MAGENPIRSQLMTQHEAISNRGGVCSAQNSLSPVTNVKWRFIQNNTRTVNP